MLLDMSTVPRRPLLQPSQDLGAVETVLPTEAVRRQPIANYQFGHCPHVHFKHFSYVLSGEDIWCRISVIRELFTHDRSNELANFVRRQHSHPSHYVNLSYVTSFVQRYARLFSNSMSFEAARNRPPISCSDFGLRLFRISCACRTVGASATVRARA